MEGGRIYGGTNHFARRKGGSAAVKTIWRYMKLRLGRIGLSVSVKLLASVLELLIPYILEHIIDRVVPGGRVGPVVGCQVSFPLSLCFYFNYYFLFFCKI